MVVQNLVKKKTKAQAEEENESESESEIEFEYNDAEDDDDEESSEEENDSDDSETEDSEDEEPDTTQTSGKKKGKTSKLKRAAESEEDDEDADEEESDEEESDDDDDSEELDDEYMTEEPKKKKRKKMSKLEKSTDDRESEEEAGDDDDDSEEEEGAADGDDESEEGEEEEEEEEVKAHKGFANALSNILSKKTVSSKKIILALGKTDREIKKLKDSKLPPEEQESKEPFLTPQELEEKRLKRKVWLEMGKVKVSALERNRERDLKMIATRGVVQLFNAVKKQQKMVNENLSDAHSIRKKDMIIESMNKKSFINLLQNNKVDVSMETAEKETLTAKEPERKIWSVLKDDFVIGTGKMKDWDKQDDIEAL